ncbi:MAG: hypothetical protein WA609_05845 [Terriglobales bacterium]
MIRLRRGLTALLLLVYLAPLAGAGDFWLKKPYHNWSADETQRMLAESPWATTLSLSGVQTDIAEGANGGGYRGEMETNPTITYTLRFGSARPIREAQVRSAQIGSHYDSMTAEQKAAFDANANKFLAVAFPDRVVVTVTFHSDVQNFASVLRNYWTHQSLAKLSVTTYLHTKTDRLSLIGYSVKEDTFQLTFPRPKQLQPDDKLAVEFVHPRVNVIGEQRVFQQFSVKKMLVDGEPAF